MTIIHTIIEQHVEESAFLWLLRDAAVRDPHFDLNDLVKLDGRLEAHVDGQRIAEKAGWGICKQALELEEPGEVFAASVLAFEAGDAQRIEDVLQLELHLKKHGATWSQHLTGLARSSQMLLFLVY